MSVFRRCRLPVAALVVLMVVGCAIVVLRRDVHRSDPHALSLSVIRGGRDNAGLYEQRHSASGIIPGAFFVVPTSVTQGERDPPQNLARPASQSNKVESNGGGRDDLNNSVLSELHKQQQVKSDRESDLSQRNVLSETNTVQKNATKPAPTTTSPPQYITTTTASLLTLPPTLPTFQPSKELFVRAVHFDDRPRDGHRNTSVFLVVALRTITDNNLIIGCQVDDNVGKDFKVALIGETPLWRAFYNHINHEEVMVHCYDLPATSNSTGYISYKMSVNSTVKMAASERLVRFPAPYVRPTSEVGKKYNLTIVACAKIFSSPPWLEEWIMYQKTLGVDHIHFDAEDTFKKGGSFNNPHLQAAIKSGFVSVEFWKQYLNGNELWYHNQGLIYEDCAYRFRNTYDYIVMVDTDDFFTPRVPGEGKLHYYIDKYCRGKTTGSCKFKWVEFFPDYYGLDKNVTVEDGNVTRRLSNYSHYNQGNPKSLHRTNVVLDAATHYAYRMIPGFRIEQVSPNVAYFAHLRKKKNPPSRGLRIGIPHSSACLAHVISRGLVILLLALCMLWCV